MLDEAVATASPIEAEGSFDPLETISPAVSNARIDHHSIFGIHRPRFFMEFGARVSGAEGASVVIPAQV